MKVFHGDRPNANIPRYNASSRRAVVNPRIRPTNVAGLKKQGITIEWKTEQWGPKALYWQDLEEEGHKMLAFLEMFQYNWAKNNKIKCNWVLKIKSMLVNR